MKDYWEREKTAVLKQFFTNKKNSKKQRGMAKKINAVDSKVRDRIINLYLEKCKTEYNVKFLKWRLNHLFLKGAPEGIDEH